MEKIINIFIPIFISPQKLFKITFLTLKIHHEIYPLNSPPPPPISTQCLEMDIPDGDDAHLLFIPFNNDIDNVAEDWYVTQLSEISRHESSQFLQDLEQNKEPSAVKTNSRKTKSKSKVTVKVENSIETKKSTTFNLSYFKLTKMENIAEKLSSSKKWDESRGQYTVCFAVRGRNDVRILFESVAMSEYMERQQKRHLFKKEHLTPLEKAFDDGIAFANSVRDEMYYMEKREIRMKQTADGTNSRLKYFSLLSICVLLSVTYLQVSYLKNYFRKKKIL